ncbi:hypothetical protein [Suicoccus acidiformans]|uniref:hypothetical protein n=1 Tax=Suicoccus acidiformans TaxID=2036206 RepID=UPI0019698F2F|nr:hypothetical protein [Suicoccus acidiformans]
MIMEYRDWGLSRNQIAKMLGTSRNSVREVFNRAVELKISFEDIQETSENKVYQLFFPNRHQSEIFYNQPNYEKVHEELKRVGGDSEAFMAGIC